MDKKHRLGTVVRSAVMLAILGVTVLPSPYVAAEDLAVQDQALSIQNPSATGQAAQVPAQKAIRQPVIPTTPPPPTKCSVAPSIMIRRGSGMR